MRVVELAGGVGGAKLGRGLQAAAGAALTIIVNTGDDLDRHGLLVCPDHDTILYTLAGLDNREWGWGVAGETFASSSMLERYGEETWFRLGDRDLATHIVRNRLLHAGATLTEANRHLQRSLGIAATILPMTDDPVRTEVETADGWLDFQEYFVHRHQAPDVLAIRFRGAAAATPTPGVLAALDAAEVIVVAPSNPFVSIAPILAVAGIAEAIAGARRRGAPVIAVSGIVGGHAVKGPADRMLSSLGHEASALGVARLLAPWIDAFVLDTVDAGLAPGVAALGVRAHVTDTMMVDDAARERLAAELLALA